MSSSVGGVGSLTSICIVAVLSCQFTRSIEPVQMTGERAAAEYRTIESVGTVEPVQR